MTLQRLLSRHLWQLLVMPVGDYITRHDQPTRHSSIPQPIAVRDSCAVNVYCTLPPIASQISFCPRGLEPHRSTLLQRKQIINVEIKMKSTVSSYLTSKAS